jgi:hypothetical protein
MDEESASVNQNRKETASALSQMGYCLRWCWWAQPQPTENYLRGFGFTLEWNEGAKWWQPFICIFGSRTQYQIGWLYEGDT